MSMRVPGRVSLNASRLPSGELDEGLCRLSVTVNRFTCPVPSAAFAYRLKKPAVSRSDEKMICSPSFNQTGLSSRAGSNVSCVATVLSS